MPKKTKRITPGYLRDDIGDYLAQSEHSKTESSDKSGREVMLSAYLEKHTQASEFLRLYRNSLSHLDDVAKSHFEEERKRNFPVMRTLLGRFALDIHGKEGERVHLKKHGSL